MSSGDDGDGVISVAPGTKVFLACRPVDLRNGFCGRDAEQQVTGADPFICSAVIPSSSAANAAIISEPCVGTAAVCG